MVVRLFNPQSDRFPLLGRLHPAFYPAPTALGARFFPAQWGEGSCPLVRVPVPIHPLKLFQLRESCLPHLEENPCLHPFSKPIMSGRMRAQFRLVKGLPLTSRS